MRSEQGLVVFDQLGKLLEMTMVCKYVENTIAKENTTYAFSFLLFF